MKIFALAHFESFNYLHVVCLSLCLSVYLFLSICLSLLSLEPSIVLPNIIPLCHSSGPNISHYVQIIQWEHFRFFPCFVVLTTLFWWFCLHIHFFFRVKKPDYADVTSLGIISMLCFLPFALLTPHNTLPSPQSHVVNVFPFLPLLPSSPVQPSFTLTSFTVVFPPLHPALLILIIKSLTAGRRTLRRKHKQFLMRSRQVTDFFTRML